MSASERTMPVVGWRRRFAVSVAALALGTAFSAPLPDSPTVRIEGFPAEQIPLSVSRTPGPPDACPGEPATRFVIRSRQRSSRVRSIELTAVACRVSTPGTPSELSLLDSKTPQQLWLVDARGRRRRIWGRLVLRLVSSGSTMFVIEGRLAGRVGSPTGRRVHVTFEFVDRPGRPHIDLG